MASADVIYQLQQMNKALVEILKWLKFLAGEKMVVGQFEMSRS